ILIFKIPVLPSGGFAGGREKREFTGELIEKRIDFRSRGND
nr:hypothetical protein [Tanacetum cinerariifolium]